MLFGCFLFCVFFTLLHLFSLGGYATQLPNISHLDAYYNLWKPGLKLVLFHASFSELELIICFLSLEFYLSPFLYISLSLLLCGRQGGWVTGLLFPSTPILSCSFLFLPDFPSIYLLCWPAPSVLSPCSLLTAQLFSRQVAVKDREIIPAKQS